MSSPQEVIERAIAHPSDATPQSRRAASGRVLKALAANEYGFMRRRRPVQDAEDGECQTCKREMVHVDHGEVYMDALERMYRMGRRMESMEAALRNIADGVSDPGQVALAALAKAEKEP